jgi:Flp pilus assembly pilin Flp
MQISFKKLLIDEQGGVFLEYGLLLTLIALVCILAVTVFGESVLDLFTTGNLPSIFI